MNSTAVKRSRADESSTREFKVLRGFPASSRERVKVMLLGGDQPALRNLYSVLRSNAKVTLAEDLPSALEKLSREEISAVFCAACFHCGSWVEALQTIGFLHPEIPVIIVNEASQNRTFAERHADIYAAGAFDVLPDPQDEWSVMVVLTHALASGESRQWQAAS